MRLKKEDIGMCLHDYLCSIVTYGSIDRKYFNVDQNYLDALINFIWIILFIFRMVFIANATPFEDGSATGAQMLYLLIFGIEIVLLTIRALLLFSNMSYLGTMIRAIKLMSVEIGKFLSIVCYVTNAVNSQWKIQWKLHTDYRGDRGFCIWNLADCCSESV